MAPDRGGLHPFPRQKSPRNYSFWVLSSLLVVSYTPQRDQRDTPSSGEEPATVKDLEMNTVPAPVDPTLFKAYDVRGIADENLTDEVAYSIGRAAAHYLTECRAGASRGV